MKAEYIRTYVRVRPSNETGVLGITPEKVTLLRTGEIFTFNEVFDDKAGNDHVYQQTMSNIIPSLMQGYNGKRLIIQVYSQRFRLMNDDSACVLAYGQTNSGKTFTMKGEDGCWGIIPLTIRQFDKNLGAFGWIQVILVKFRNIFEEINQLRTVAKVSISYFEIYNENIIDLLAQEQPPKYLQLRDDGKKNAIICDLTEHMVTSQMEALTIYQRGERGRKFASNNINLQSSRSHSIFRINLSLINKQHEKVDSTINMVDLAGSESISKTNAVGILKKQGQNINKSLLALSIVIRNISSSSKDYVNFRDSKLTRILQPSLQGQSKAIVICTVQQTEECLPETISTLRFGVSANKISVVAKRNAIADDDSRYKALNQLLSNEREARMSAQKEVIDLRIEAQGLRNDRDRLQEQRKELLKELQLQHTHSVTHMSLINQYKRQREQYSNDNMFKDHNRHIEVLQQTNSQLKQEIAGYIERLKGKDKGIQLLQKNQKYLLGRIDKYEKELETLTQNLKEENTEQSINVRPGNQSTRDGKNSTRQGRNVREGKTPQISRNQVPQHQNQLQQFVPAEGRRNFMQMAFPSRPTRKVSNPMTIGTVLDLHAEIINLKLKMRDYEKSIVQLHEDSNRMEVQIAQLKQQKLNWQRNNPEVREQLHNDTPRSQESRMSFKSTKMISKGKNPLGEKVTKLERNVAQLKRSNQILRKALKNATEIQRSRMEGFNEYVMQNTNGDEIKMFELITKEKAEDFEPLEYK